MKLKTLTKASSILFILTLITLFVGCKETIEPELPADEEISQDLSEIDALEEELNLEELDELDASIEELESLE